MGRTPHITTSLRKNVAVHHNKKCALMSQKSGGTATPAVKKLSPKAGAACFRNCMHGVSGAGWATSAILPATAAG